MKYRDLLTKGSHCEKCGKELRWYELVPVLSFLFSKGKCRKCGAKINPVYFGAELIFGTTTLLLYLYGVHPIVYVWAATLGFLAIYDALYKGVPKSIMHLYLLLGVVWLGVRLVQTQDVTLLYPTVIALMIFAAVELLNKRKMVFGRGDSLTLIYIATISTTEMFVTTIVAAFLISGIFALVALLAGLVKRKGYIPFIPFLAVGYLAALLLAQKGVSFFDYIFLLW